MRKEKTILEYAQAEIKACDAQIKKAQEKLSENFVYAFEWSYPETQYRFEIRKRKIQQFIDFVNEQPERAEEWLSHNIESITTDLTERQLIKTSTSTFSNLAHLLKKEESQEVLKMYKAWLQWLTGEEPSPLK